MLFITFTSRVVLCITFEDMDLAGLNVDIAVSVAHDFFAVSAAPDPNFGKS